MKVFYWNVRGFANPDTKLMVKNLCIKHRPDVLFLCEPWIDIDQVHSSFWVSLRLKHLALNSRGAQSPNLWAFCAKHFDPVILQDSRQHISLSLIWHQQPVFVSGI